MDDVHDDVHGDFHDDLHDDLEDDSGHVSSSAQWSPLGMSRLQSAGACTRLARTPKHSSHLEPVLNFAKV